MSEDYVEKWIQRAFKKKLHNVKRISFEITRRQDDDLWIDLYFFDNESEEAFKVFHDVHINIGGILNIELGP